MTEVRFCGKWFVSTCDTKLVAVHTKQKREPFVFDCSTADKRPKNTKNDNNSDDGASEEMGSDRVLAFTVSPSGNLVALTDDTKRLVLFRCELSWQCVSIRWVARRCTALVFSQTEDELLVADKSGDVYSFSVVEPQRDGELKMGHLSMLLDITMSPDDKYIITADRDEKIRVSHFRCPYNIQSFCLGHQQFVSALLVPSAQSHCLLSGSGDGTVKLWEYETGLELKSWDLKDLEETPSSNDDKEKILEKLQAHLTYMSLGQLSATYAVLRKMDWNTVNLNYQRPAVCRITSSPDGCHIAVLCERVSMVQFFTLDMVGKEKLVPHSRLSLPHCPLDMMFDSENQLWVLMDCSDAPLQIFSHRQGSWECCPESPELHTVSEAFRPHWVTREAFTSRFEHLYKTSFDNVTEYLQKKQQRLEEQQLKRVMKPKTNNNKKAKKDTSVNVNQ